VEQGQMGWGGMGGGRLLRKALGLPNRDGAKAQRWSYARPLAVALVSSVL